MTDAENASEFPFRFAGEMPDPVRDAVLRWWRSTGSKSGTSWDWLRVHTASSDDMITGGEDDVYPPSFADWHGILGRICASEDVAKAAAQFEAAHSPDAKLWLDLVLRTLKLPTEFIHQDKRTNKEKAQVLRSLCGHIERAATAIDEELRIAEPEFRPGKSPSTLPAKAAVIDSPRVPDELRHDHEKRKLYSEYRLYDAGLLWDLWTDPVRLDLRRAASGREVDEDAEPVGLSACVSAQTFGEIAKALAARLRAELQDLSERDLMQLSKGYPWHRFAVMHLEEVFSDFYGSRMLADLPPGPNQIIAGFTNAAVPEATTTPVSLKRVSEIRTSLSTKLAALQQGR